MSDPVEKEHFLRLARRDVDQTQSFTLFGKNFADMDVEERQAATLWLANEYRKSLAERACLVR